MYEHSNLRQAIVKVTQTCNLNCHYCYVYNLGDGSWKTRPKLISPLTVTALAKRIKEHCDKHHIPKFYVELHGGEPLLIGIRRMRSLLEEIISVAGIERIKFSIQTNGLLLNEIWVDLFSEFQTNVGISLDGPPSPLSLRVDHKGRDTTQRLLDILAHLQDVRPLFNPGILVVLSDQTDISYLLDWFPSIGIKSFDFLLPLGNYVTPPVSLQNKSALADKLIKAFDHWYSKGINAPQVRFFECIIEGFLGHKIYLDSFGGDLSTLCVVESDGGIGLSDVVRFCGSEYSKDAINIFDSPLDRHNSHFQIAKISKVSDQCSRCEVLNACGGGYLPDRYDGKSFQNPTYYCEVMFSICSHVKNRLSECIPERAWVEEQL